MKLTISSPHDCGHITVATDTGEVYHSHLEELRSKDARDLPPALAMVRDAMGDDESLTVAGIRALVEPVTMPDMKAMLASPELRTLARKKPEAKR